MSILIKGMDLPKGDDDVRLIITSDGTVHRILGWAVSEKTNHKAIELPSHGRLIDVDLFSNTITRDSIDDLDAYDSLFGKLYDAPTVIEASN